MENQPPAKNGKQPFVEPEPKTEQYKQAQAAAEMHSLIFRRKLERGMSKEEASTSSATKPDHEAETQPKVPFPWPA